MIAVGNSFVAAARAVPVSGFVTGAGVPAAAFRRILGIHFQLVFIHMIAMHIVHVAIVKETLVAVVQESRVAALISMLMRVSLMSFMTHVLILLCGAMPRASRRSQKSLAGSGIEPQNATPRLTMTFGAIRSSSVGPNTGIAANGMDSFAGWAYSPRYDTFRA
jgi:hypothetical protein